MMNDMEMSDMKINGCLANISFYCFKTRTASAYLTENLMWQLRDISHSTQKTLKTRLYLACRVFAFLPYFLRGQ
jgi:hypothetical protein